MWESVFMTKLTQRKREGGDGDGGDCFSLFFLFSNIYVIKGAVAACISTTFS